MRRILIGAAAALLLIVGSGVARAADDSGVEAGVKMWINDWTREDPRFGSIITSDTIILFGPTIDVKFPNHVFFDASYLFSLSDYTFPADAFGISDNRNRKDVDVSIGYMIVPVFGVLAGYKNSVINTRETGIKETLDGPFMGIILNAPMYYNASFYGKVNYLFTRFKQQGGGFPGFQEDSPGWMWEFGFKVAFTRQFYGTFGWRYEVNTGNNSSVQDSFSGLVFGATFNL
jgi:hypothetical protein